MNSRWIESVLHVAVKATGLMLFSVGLSFAMPRGSTETEQTMRLHASLIALGGLGLFSAGILLGRMMKRMDRPVEPGTRSSE